ncbi:hypothetical protein [Metapseudomonas furukawaii]|jgi:hypothetical protein|uniref:Transcriptional regulator SutA RNAP-binding domain-containing protein n=1 Tax=Metapseudomonas furukawaii TaxID=1149133 RepID=A0AAD1BZP6_METFU|nr:MULTISPECIES: hypothetical protein [Pseudomonas]ELS28731.1 hypothetical protein ppKF707_3722 [Pseudomonas furukawaii]OWJ94993.1 hypothetical protein B6S59_12790 [Pseudomonas sp. A46]WAG80684.1 hypothetical protein LMK08_08435 [Pseudomonas furukawaii]BAU73507.1 hypothetical protein KF707C_18190 [Pseudomonas furukawaii]
MRIKTSHSSTPKPPAASTTREDLEAQIAAFLKKGGEIQEIERGVSAQVAPSRHIRIGNK